MLSLSDYNQADIVEAIHSTSSNLDGFLNIDNPYFAQMVSHIYIYWLTALSRVHCTRYSPNLAPPFAGRAYTFIRAKMTSFFNIR